MSLHNNLKQIGLGFHTHHDAKNVPQRRVDGPDKDCCNAKQRASAGRVF